jgi:Zn-dependent protease with chaperone function
VTATLAGEEVRPGDAARPPTAPAASLVRFLLLVITVVATSAFIFLQVYLLIPSKQQRMTDTTNACAAAQEADPAFNTPIVTDEDVARAREVSRRFQACMRPTLLDSVAFVGVGLALLFGSAIVAYLVQPGRMVRRRRLMRLSDRGPSALLDELERLRGSMGLSRSPDWRLAPFARTTGGQAFGSPWHRYIQIDAGLAVLRVTDPAGFRAVVRHELAHLRNRDVDKTYLTIGIWRAFIVVALIPYLILMLHPQLFLTPLDFRWSNVTFVADPASAWYRFGSLLVLAALVYLTRNAILRIRETHADATAAAGDGPDSALPAVLRRLPTPPWWRRWGTHPSPRQRLDTVRDPRLLLTTGFWELVGVGIATGLVCTSVGFLIGINFTVDPALAVAVVGLITGALAVGLLAVAIWRTTAGDPARPPSARAWLAFPAALVAGFVAGTFLTLLEATTVTVDTTSVSPRSRLISTAVLLAGAVFVAAWTASVARAVLARTHRSRWAMPAVVAATIAVGAVWFAVWLPYSLLEDGFADGWGVGPAAGVDIGWYAAVAAVTGAGYGPMGRLVFNPLTLTGLTLMWLVPVLALARRRPVPLRTAFAASLIGAAAMAALGALLPFATRWALPARVRGEPDADASGASFAVIYENAGIALASIVIAVVVVVVLVRGGPPAPAVAVLAGCLTTILCAVVLTYVAIPISCRVSVWASTLPEGCVTGVPVIETAQKAHWALLQAILLAVPAGLVVAAVRILRTRPASAATTSAASAATTSAASAVTGSAGPRVVGVRTVVAGVALTLLVAATLWFAGLTWPVAYTVWFERAFGP